MRNSSATDESSFAYVTVKPAHERYSTRNAGEMLFIRCNLRHRVSATTTVSLHPIEHINSNITASGSEVFNNVSSSCYLDLGQ
jgi:hypothetical protein